MVAILDTTLREGEQTPGVAFGAHIKLAIADLLDEIGVDVIEAGHPAVTPAIAEAVRELARRGLRATIAAHARSLERDVDLALACGAGMIGIFYCVSDERLSDQRTSLSCAVERIQGVIARIRAAAPDVSIRYTPEDGVRSRFDNVVTAATAAVEAGADIISVADTTGYMIPGTRRSMYDFVCRLRAALEARGLAPTIAVHCHNDRGLALANALDGIRAGAGLVDAAVLGLGERAGIVDLATLLAVLATDLGYSGRWRLHRLPELYRLVSEHGGVTVPINAPVCGANAFTHCAGVHSQAAIRNPLHYQSLSPEPFGRRAEVALGHMAGLAALRHCLDRVGLGHLDDEQARAVLARVKEIGQHGRRVSDRELIHIVRLTCPALAAAHRDVA
ncbi:MAG: 2-isopropylmalate synthase [Acidobacteriota bacterium]|jgi:2-isopropylmalate synthase